ncbi:MAG: hypothetical protein AABX33_05475 [Nanoarchaeota archaeon]
MLTTRVDYVKLERLVGHESNIKEFEVPQFLLRYKTDPIGYANLVNGLRILKPPEKGHQGHYQTLGTNNSCAIEELEDKEKTLQERAKIVRLSPRLMVAIEGDRAVLSIKKDVSDSLLYEGLRERRVMASITDYVFGSLAARIYLGLEQIEFSKLKEEGRFGIYTTKTRNTPANPKKLDRTLDFEAFLLSELISFRSGPELKEIVSKRKLRLKKK